MMFINSELYLSFLFCALKIIKMDIYRSRKLYIYEIIINGLQASEFSRKIFILIPNYQMTRKTPRKVRDLPNDSDLQNDEKGSCEGC